MGTRRSKRRYVSAVRRQGADATKTRILDAARGLFARRGIDQVTIEQMARKANVAASTVYALYRSKEGVLRALMRQTLFGPRFAAAMAKLEGVTAPVRLIALTAQVARAIYEGEADDLGLVRGASAFSPAVRKLEQEFEGLRLQMQKERLERLFARSQQKEGLTFAEAQRILWMYTSRDVYRMLVHEGDWTPERYEQWLSATLVEALVRSPRPPQS